MPLVDCLHKSFIFPEPHMILSPWSTQPLPAWACCLPPLQDPILTALLPPSTLSAWASRDFKLLVTIFSSSSRSPHLLQGVCGRMGCEGTVWGDSGDDGTVGEGWRREEKSKVVRVTAGSLEAPGPSQPPQMRESSLRRRGR